MLHRLRRKWNSIRRYPELAYASDERRDLWLLGLSRNRILAPSVAARFTRSRSTQITPRLKVTRGQPVSLNLAHAGQIDCFDELFFENIYELTAVPFSPDLVADCGAFSGYFTAMAAGAFPSAHRVCWEANPDNLPLLSAQLALLSGQVELHPVAAYVRDGYILFSGTGVGGAVHGGDADEQSRKIPCEDFPAWLRGRAPERLVWKLDVEGAEIEILPAALPLLPAQTVCFLETHHPDVTNASLLDPYRAAGFSVREIRRRPSASETFDYVEWLLIRN